jgi:type III secretion protein Q
MSPETATLQAEPASATRTALLGLRRVDAGVARWSRVLHDARLSAALRHRLPQLALRAVDEPPAGCALAMHLENGDKVDETMEVEIAQADHPGWAMAVGPGTSDALRHLAALALFEPVARALEGLGLGRWTPTRATARTPAPRGRSEAASPWLRLCRESAPLATLRITQTAPGWLDAAKERLCTHSPAASECARMRLALPARVTVHTQSYGSGLLASLNLGDVLVLPCPTQPETPWPVVVRWGATGSRGLRVAGRMVGTTVVIEGAHSVANDEVEEVSEVLEESEGPETGAADDARPVRNVGDIAVPVRFELETAPVALHEIESLAPGYVLELASPLAHATLRLVVCGQVIGHAELVSVGEQLGARITRLAAT